jgi:hypothetical protein
VEGIIILQLIEKAAKLKDEIDNLSMAMNIDRSLGRIGIS